MLIGPFAIFINMTRLTTESHQLFEGDVLEKLRSKNIFTVLDFVEADAKQIASITALSYKEILSIKNYLLNKNSAVVKNALEYYHELLLNSAILSTGIKSVDILLEGGLKTGNIYEICGTPASGKTQFCLTITKYVTQNLNQKVYYIDTKHDFSAKKIKSMFLDSEKEQVGDVMERILVNKINTIYELINVLHDIKSNFNDYKLKLIIIDSLPALIYQFSNIQSSYGLLNHAVNIMRFLMKQYHVVFVVTNALTNWVEGNFGKDNEYLEKIGSGKFWYSVPNTRLKISKRIFDYEISVEKSTFLPSENKCYVKISNLGMICL